MFSDDHNNFNGYSMQKGFMSKVFGLMFSGLGLSASMALLFSPDINPGLFKSLVNGPHMLLLFAQLGLVFYLSFNWQRISGSVAGLLFLAYSALSGITLSPLLYIYTSASLFQTFAVAASMFGVMALYGWLTNDDLSSIGSIAGMGVIGILVAMLVNYFMQSSQLDFLISCFGVLIFTVLTAYDIQKLKYISHAPGALEEMGSNIAVMGALTLYLDLLNLFLFLLRLLGDRRR